MTPTQDYLALPDPEAATLISSRVREWDEQEPLRYASLGLMALAVEKRMLWRHVTDKAHILQQIVAGGQIYTACVQCGVRQEFIASEECPSSPGLPCRSFARWVRYAAPRGYSVVYAALRDCEELADVPAADLAQIPASNFHTLKQLSSRVRRTPAVLEAAKTQRAEEFVGTIRRDFPNQHIEHKRALRFNPDESAAERIEEALDLAMEHGAANRNDALELLAAMALQAWQEESREQDTSEGLRVVQ
jgi:hypothetical protein